MSFIPKTSHQDTQKQQKAASGNFLYSTSVNEQRPVWTGGHFVFRILPYHNEEYTESYWEPMSFKDGEEDHGFGNWSFEGLVASFAGHDKKVSFFLRDSYDGDFCLEDSPYYVLYKAIQGSRRSMTKTPWADKLDSSGKAGPELPNPTKPTWFMQGLVYFKGNESCAIDVAKPAVIRLTDTAANSLRAEIDKEVDKNSMFDIAALDQSNFVTMWNSSSAHPYLHTPGADTKKYSVCITHQYQGNDMHNGEECVLTQYEDRIKSAVRPWNRIFKFLSYEEQAEQLRRAFTSDSDMLLYAWADHPEWITPDIRNKADRRRVDSSVYRSAYPQQNGYPENVQEVQTAPFDGNPQNAPWSRIG